MDRLNGCVVMILMHFAVDDRLCILVTGLRYMLVLDGWIDALVDGGIVFSIFVKETTDCRLCFIHFEYIADLKGAMR